MALASTVNHSLPCPKCGQEVTNWLTKDIEAAYGLNPQDVSHFWGSCRGCGEYVEIHTAEGSEGNWPEDYVVE